MNFSSDEFDSLFTNVLIEIVSKISGFSFSVLSSEPDGDFDGAAGMTSLNGQNSGILFISAGEADMRVLCSYMTGVPQDDITKEDTDDALCELVNMTAGNVKLRLGNADPALTFSTPFAVSGENMSLVTKKRVHVMSRRLGNEEISLKLKVLYA